jgi:hypothetical protein
MAAVVPVAFRKLPHQALVDRPWTEDQHVVVPVQPVRDVSDESVQMFNPVRLAGRLRATAAAVPDGGIVPDMAGGPMMSRYLRFHSFDTRPVPLHPDDDGLPRVDPDKRAGSMVFCFRGHECAHAGPASASSARSA